MLKTKGVSAVLVSAVLLTGFVLEETQSKVFTRCQLAKELLKQDFQRSLLTHWVCLVESESERNSTKVKAQSNRSSSYGLFQINSKKYCKEGKRGGTCNVACESLLSDDITTSAACANTVFELDGFKAWPGWMKKCKGSNNLPDISNCPDLSTASRNSPEMNRNRVNSLTPRQPILVG